MPISGFKPGQTVYTPSGDEGRVIKTERYLGREYVYVRTLDTLVGAADKRFPASVLKLREDG